ncbi:peroxiredoxin family protein [Virgibacillus byunsanensis]|uniref:Peroxiredoxin family protein n=1 Tax=Virgibacillus byunsanensis TaxID=570945 RepID=A0ABW3LNM9_9BACI
MKKGIIIAIIVGMFVWAVYDFVLQSDESTVTSGEDYEVKDHLTVNGSGDNTDGGEEDKVGLETGNMAPDFELSTLGGDTVKLSDFRGKRVMLNFWATWCPPCRAEMPDMQKFHEEKDIVILAVNLTDTEASIQDIPDFVDEFELTFPILLDEQTAVANEYQIQPIPTSFMVDSNGRIQYKAFGALNYELMVQEFEKMQ